jgi:tetratricopeptide (TPR) repeat protein
MPKVGAIVNILPIHPEPRPGHPPLSLEDGTATGIVRKIEGKWLLVRAANRDGWIKSEETGTSEQAMQRARVELARTPDDVVWLIRRGSLMMHSNRDQALADLDRAIGLDPKRAAAFSWRASVRSLRGELDLALADANRAIELDPKQARSFGLRSGIKDQKGDLDGALADLAEAIRLDPTRIFDYSFRARLWTKKGMPERAIAEFDEAVRRNPNNVGAILLRSDERLKRKEYDLALADAEEAIRRQPAEPAGFNTRAGIHRARNDREIEDLTEALLRSGQRWDFGSRILHRRRAEAFAAKKDYPRAIADYDQVIRLDPRDAGNFLSRGTARRQMGDIEGAITDFDEAIRLDPRSSSAYAYRGVCRMQKGQIDAAIADYPEGIRLNHPRVAGLYSLRSIAWIAKGDQDRARADHDEAFRLDPKGMTSVFDRVFKANPKIE